MSLNGKVALVTGASRGIGKAIALKLAEANIFVIGTATSEDGAKKISKSFENLSLKGEGIKLDVASQQSMDETIAKIKSQHGMPAILVNNAAITKDNLMLRMKDDEWSQVIETNLNAVFRLTKICLRDMLKAQWGRIINIGSVVGSSGNPGQANYCAAKAGIIGFSKSLAQEVGSRNITVNVVAPGFVDTDMTRSLPEEQRSHLINAIPMRRVGQPDDIAAAVAFLASDAAGYITGQTLHVNGGMYLG